MKKSQLSLTNFLLVCLLVLFMGLYVFQSNKSRILEDRIISLTSPIQREIDQSKWSIQKQERQLQYARAALKPKLDSITQVDLIVSNGLPSLNLNPNTTPTGIRRELANLRNAELKLNREKDRLRELEGKLDGMLNPQSN